MAKKNNEPDIKKTQKEIEISDVERKRIMESIQRTDTEKFYLFTRLMRIHFMLKNATILK